MLQKMFDNDLIVIRKSKVTLKYNKLEYVGVCILDLSKVLICNFHYYYIRKKQVNNSRLLLTDTDSLMYEIKTENVYEDFSKDKEMFDFSDYSAKSKYYDESNKLVFGKMKDETSGVSIEEIVGLKPTMYSFLADDSSKHINKSVKSTYEIFIML